MIEVSVLHLGSVQFEIKARGHSMVSDQPEEDGGFDEGMTPPELMLASLGSCVGFYAADYLKRQRLSAEGTKVRVMADKAKNPARMDNFKIEVEVPAGLSEEHVKGLQEAIHRCLIHNTLMHPPKIELAVKGLAEAPAL
jgi:uncharacterized OsmC-like protein